MFIGILEYIGIIAIVLTAIVSYNHYKAGKFSKDYIELEDDTKKPTLGSSCTKKVVLSTNL
ncbi:hypothetical protein CRV08_04635 [Halarcobacter ebronensis]|uniref:Uncharacterized protein n=1 Tax=Halarcobacter ebronensis TaxID=1462615 RepID=A0A4Q0YFG7_9BACT|nr:hypothetical protein [Halarcobacter ebronensis]RXJ69300.1 hypothetical protein CRV08_04635 [Halarcobacter ebronensis]